MALNSEQIGWLLRMIQHTRDVELSCPECVAELDRYAQRILDGEPMPEDLQRVREHLEACSGCDDEYKLILDTLDALDQA